MNSNRTEHSVERPFPDVQPAEPASVRRAYHAPTFICIDTARTANGPGAWPDSGGIDYS